MSVTLTSRMMVYLPHQRHTAFSEETRRILFWMSRSGFEVLSQEKFVFGCEAIHQDVKVDASHHLILDVLPGTAASGRHFSFITPGEDWTALHEKLEHEARYYHAVEVREGSIRIEGDPLGIKNLYKAELKEGILLASRITDLFEIEPDLIRPLDPLAVYGLFTANTIISDRTLHEKVRLTKTGECYRWDPEDGLTVTRNRRWKAPRVKAASSSFQAVKSVKEAIAGALEAQIEGTNRPLSLGISGGFDSRLLAVLLKESGKSFHSYSYGEGFYHETHIAIKVAKQLGIPHEILSYPENILLNRVQMHTELMEGQAALGCLPITNLLAITDSPGEALLHGFLGGALTGHTLNKLDDADYESKEALARGIAKSYGFSAINNVNALTHLNANLDDFLKEIHNDLQEDAEPYQALMLWDLENRQRRLIGSHVRLLGSHFDLIAPNYSRAVMEACFSLPRIALENKEVIRQIFASFYPELAKIPHASEVHPIVPNLKNQIPLYIRWQINNQIPRKIVGDKLFKKVKRPDIEFMWSGLTSEQRSAMISFSDKNRDLLVKTLDLRLCGDFDAKTAEQNMPVQNAYMFSHYAAKLRGHERRNCELRREASLVDEGTRNLRGSEVLVP